MLTDAIAWWKVSRIALALLRQHARARAHAEIDSRIEAGCSQVETFYTPLLEAELAHQDMKDPHNLLPASLAPSLPEMSTLIHNTALKNRKIKTKQLEPYAQDLVIAMYEDRTELVIKLWDKWIEVVPRQGGHIGNDNIHHSTFVAMLKELNHPSAAWFCQAEGCRKVHWLVSAMAHADAAHDGSVETMVGVSEALITKIIEDIGKDATTVKMSDLQQSQLTYCKSCPREAATYGTFQELVSDS